MGNNGRQLMHIQSQVSDMLAAVGDYIDRFDVRVDEEGYHITVGLCVPKSSALNGTAQMQGNGHGPVLQKTLELLRESANAMVQDQDEEEVVAAVDLQIEDVVSPRFVASNGVTTSVAEQPREKRPVVRRYQRINHVPLTRDGIKSQIDKEEE